jgi:glycosyltransferase involved in cell wall biosynthesis
MTVLSIIIPHLDDATRLRGCLHGLAPQMSDDTEVIVVDNGSVAPLGWLANDFPWVKLIFEPSKGAGLARNRGVAASKGQILAFLDCDCRPAEGWVSRILRAPPGGRIIGGRVDTYDEEDAPRSAAQLFERVFAFDNARYVAELGFSVTANLVTSRAVFRAVGPFRTGVPEDMEWCARARAADIAVVYDAQLVVRHPTRQNWPALRRKYQRLVSERFALRPEHRRDWAIRALLTGLSPLRDTRKVLRSPRLSGARERAMCLWVLYRLRLARMGWMFQLLRIKSDRPARL